MRASHVVQARKQSFYLQREQALLAALKERWPQQKREAALRLVAMVSVSAFRLALDNFNLEGGRQPLAALLHEAFELLQRELSEN